MFSYKNQAISSISSSYAYVSPPQLPSSHCKDDWLQNLEDSEGASRFASISLPDNLLVPSTAAVSSRDVSAVSPPQFASGCYTWSKMAQNLPLPMSNVDSIPKNSEPRSGPPAFGGHEAVLSASHTLNTLEAAPHRSNAIAARYMASGLPNPYLNHIRVNRYSLYSACHENAHLLGVIKPVAETVGFKSPFHQVGLSRDLAIQTIQTHFSFISTDLRPCTAQVLHEHEFYIDVFPFAKFRERVISLLLLSPPAFDATELRNDLDNDGLLCWGGEYGIGSCRPWDMRSWEAQPWFLAKWWMLTRGSGIEEQSRWWRSMRGEDDI